MTKYRPASRSSVVSVIPSQRPALTELLEGRKVLNLAEVAGCIAADARLRCSVVETACREFDRSRLSLEDAIVLLGRAGLGQLLAIDPSLGRSRG